MEGPIEHSDSDSGESWTLLDHAPAYAEEAPEFPEKTSIHEGDERETIVEKDEDTDGISIISDSDPESPSSCEMTYGRYEDDHTDPNKPQYIPMKASNIVDSKIIHDTMSNDDFMGDSNGKHKTYVHRRNKRLSTVLNIIVLGSVITAAGVAIGHMWGAKNDCSVNTVPSVNKILSNLYKLQEENAYLRSKLKELTQMSIHAHQRKSGTESILNKQNKCKKIFEDSINKINSDKPIKCIDIDETSNADSHLVKSAYEKQFLQDISKLKETYKQNKSWLDQEVAQRLKVEQHSIKNLKNNLKSKSDKYKKTKGQERSPINEEFLETITEISAADTNPNVLLSTSPQNIKGDIPTNSPSDRKISYADSLKSDQKANVIPKIDISTDRSGSKVKEYSKKKNDKDLDASWGYSISEDELKKDDRYVGHRHKQERKKHDRQKLHKKQKRKNKYEQWEMKAGYLKDYDDFSVSSSQENDNNVKNLDKNYVAKDVERENYSEQFLEIDNSKKVTDRDTINISSKLEKKSKNIKNNTKNKEKDVTWFEKRALLRNEARKKLEHELFGETSPNNARWYFRRMQRREQCRAKGDNSTYRKLSKRNMNFKTKH